MIIFRLRVLVSGLARFENCLGAKTNKKQLGIHMEVGEGEEAAEANSGFR